jgi:hypothetical protein
MTEEELRRKVETMVNSFGSLRAMAKAWGISPSYLCDFLNGRRGPGGAILGRLGLVPQVTVLYVPGEASGRRRRPVRPIASGPAPGGDGP